MVAALGVVLDPETNTMKTFGGQQSEMVAKNVSDDSKTHMDDILSLDMSSDRKSVITGQVGRNPSVHVWDPITMESTCTFKVKEGARGVQAVSMSPCLRYVAAVDMHNDHHVVIYNVKKNKELLFINGSGDKIVDCAWSKKEDDLRFVTVGGKELKFWYPADATKRLSVKGTFGPKREMTSFSTAVFDTEGICYTAGANGNLYTWDQTGQIAKVVKGHSSDITALAHESGKLFSGGKDNKFNIYKAEAGDLVLEKSIDFEGGYPRAIDYMNGKILMGLRNGSIYEINEATEEKKLLMASHHEGEAWGLQVVPEINSIFTVGDDNKLMQFNYEERKFVKQGKLSDHPPKNA